MSDFFTKKQRKFWCDTCKLFIEYTKLSIDQHNRSKNHLRLVNRDIEYKNQKVKFQKMHGLGITEAQNPIGNQAANFPGKSQQIDPLTGYLPEEANKNLLNRKTQREKTQNTNANRNTNNNQSLNAILFDEIKKEKMQTELNKNTNSMVNRSWVMFWDYTYNLPYYFNNMTGASQWEKPAEFDSFNLFNPQVQQANLNLNQQMPVNPFANHMTINAYNFPKNDNFNTYIAKNQIEDDQNSDSESEDDMEQSENSLEKVEDDEEENKETAGIIGKWEVVEKDQSVFAPKKTNKEENPTDNLNTDIDKNKEHKEESVDSEEEKVKNEYYIPGLMNKDEFLLKEYGDEFDDGSESSDKAGFGVNDGERKDKSGLENIENLENRDNEEKAESEENYNGSKRNEKKELSKEDLIKLNKRLKQRDYDFRYMDLKDKQDHIPQAEEPISIDIKPVKFNRPKVKRNMLLNEEED